MRTLERKGEKKRAWVKGSRVRSDGSEPADLRYDCEALSGYFNTHMTHMHALSSPLGAMELGNDQVGKTRCY